jgi:hypothetical protein
MAAEPKNHLVCRILPPQIMCFTVDSAFVVVDPTNDSGVIL